MLEDVAYSFEGKDRPVRLIGSNFPVEEFLVFDPGDNIIEKTKQLLHYAALDNVDFALTDQLKDLMNRKVVSLKVININGRKFAICMFDGRKLLKKVTRNGKVAIFVFNNRYMGYIQ
jgi:uncharacterized Fe-S cluster-containing protein